MIYVTGASGYLGGRICALAPDFTTGLARGENYAKCRGHVIIHCGWAVPKTDADADNRIAQENAYARLVALLLIEPSFLVFISTRTGGGVYRQMKQEAERAVQRTRIPHHIVRFPGLFGPPRRAGLVYNALRAILAGESFQAERPLPEWTGMHVDQAAALCLYLAQAKRQGITDARDSNLEAMLTWARS